MATRASLARNIAPKEVYEGRVHKWERRWLVHKKGTVKTEVMLELLRWIVTDEQCPDLTGPRHPNIKPLKRPVIKQPSKKPAEQAGEQAGEQRPAADGQPAPDPTDQAAGQAAEQPAAKTPAEQPPEKPTTVADRSAELASKPPEERAVGVELQPPLTGDVNTEEGGVVNGDSPRGSGNAQPQQKETDGEAAALGDTHLPDAAAGGSAAPGDPTAGAVKPGAAEASIVADGQAPGQEQLTEPQDVEMGEMGTAS